MSHHQHIHNERAAEAPAPGEAISACLEGPAGEAVDLRLDAGQGQPAQEQQPDLAQADAQEQEQPAADDQQQLSKQELESDSFRMFSFKVVQCKNPDDTHDWTECPFAHVGEKANRRDPRLFRYTGISCPDYRKGACKRGSVCPYAHGVFEVWLHPSRYRTQLCKDGQLCSRQVCFFAHGSSELREVAPEDLPVLEAGSSSSAGSSTHGSEASSEPPAAAASLSSSSDSDSSSDSGGSTTAAAARTCKGATPAPASSGERGAGAAAAASSRGTAPTASKLQQIKPASLQQKQQQSLDWATAFSDPQLFMSRQASTASSVGSGSHASGLGLASYSSLGSQASLALSAGTPGSAAAAGQPGKQGLALQRGGGTASRLLRVPLDIAVEAAAVAASAGVAPLSLSDTFGSLTDPAALACPSPPLHQQQHALGALAGLAGDAGPWPALLPPVPHNMVSGGAGSPADVAAQAAAAAAAHLSLLQQLGSLPGSNPALAATMAAQQAAAAQQEMLHAALLQQQAAQQQQQQQRDLMWTAAYHAAADVGLNPLTAAACADCAVQTAAAAATVGSCGLPQPAPASQLQLLLQLQQHGSPAAAAVHPAGLGLQHLQLAAGPGSADALFAQKQLAAAGGLLGGCNGVVGGIPGMAALPECAAASYGFY